MKNTSDQDLFLKLSDLVEHEREAKFNKGRRYVKAQKIEVENELIGRGYEKWQIQENLLLLNEEVEEDDDSDWQMPSRNNLKSRIMYIEDKSEGLEGDARIGRVYFSKSGKSLYYKDKRFQSLKGSGFKANYFDVDSGKHYWISGPRKDQNDRLYGGFKDVEIDEDVREEYLQYLKG